MGIRRSSEVMSASMISCRVWEHTSKVLDDMLLSGGMPGCPEGKSEKTLRVTAVSFVVSLSCLSRQKSCKRSPHAALSVAWRMVTEMAVESSRWKFLM